MAEAFDRDTLHDYVVAHGFGAPTEEAYEKVAEAWDTSQKDYAAFASAIVMCNMTIDLEDEENG